MRKRTRSLAIGIALGCGIWALAIIGAAQADDEDDKLIKAAQKDVLALAKEIEAGKTDPTKLKAIRKNYTELQHPMYVFKPTNKGGVGFPPKGDADGIELKISNMSKAPLSPRQLKAQRAALIKVGYLSIAMSEVSMQYVPAAPKGGKGAKEWKAYAADMKKASQALIAAVNKESPAAVKTSAFDLSNSCLGCHKDFRN